MIRRIAITLLLSAYAAFGQLQMGSGTNITVAIDLPDTVMAWISTNPPTDWHHWASNSTGSYIDGIAAAFPIVPWTYDGTNLVVGAGDFAVDELIALANSITTNQIAQYILDTAPYYSLELAADTNLLAIAERWDTTAGNPDCLLALDLENLGVASGVALTGFENLDAALVSYWAMNTNGSTTVFDEYGANDVTAVGSPLFGTAYGKYLNGIALNGSSQRIDCGNDASLQGTNFSVSAWIKTADAGSGYRGITVKQNNYNLFLNNNVLVCFDYGGSAERSSGTNLADSAWHHVVGVFVGGIAGGSSLYVDGEKALDFSYSRVNDSSSLTIGSNLALQPLAGQIDEVAIVNRSLSPTEVSTIYNSGEGKFYGAATINDRSSYGNDAAVVGSPIHVMPDRRYSNAWTPLELAETYNMQWWDMSIGDNLTDDSDVPVADGSPVAKIHPVVGNVAYDAYSSGVDRDDDANPLGGVCVENQTGYNAASSTTFSTNGYTYAAIFKTFTDGYDRGILHSRVVDGNEYCFRLFSEDYSSSNVSAYVYDEDVSLILGTSDAGISTSTGFVFTVATFTQSDKLLRINSNGGIVSTNAHAGDGIDTIRYPDETIIGWAPGEVQGAWLLEALEIGDAITDDERMKLEGYWAHKWGLTDNLPADHPYKSTAP